MSFEKGKLVETVTHMPLWNCSSAFLSSAPTMPPTWTRCPETNPRPSFHFHISGGDAHRFLFSFFEASPEVV